MVIAGRSDGGASPTGAGRNQLRQKPGPTCGPGGRQPLQGHPYTSGTCFGGATPPEKVWGGGHSVTGILWNEIGGNAELRRNPVIGFWLPIGRAGHMPA